MNQNQIFLILEKLGDIQSVLSANAQKIENIHDNATKDQKVLDELVKDRTSFKVFCAEQVKINSKLNGRFESHHQWVEQEINNCKDFAAREINLINQKYEEDKKGKKSEEVLKVSKMLAENTATTKSISRVQDDLVCKVEEQSKKIHAFDIHIANQGRIDSRLEGIVTNQQKQLEAIPETIRREIFGQVNKLQETVDKVEKEHSEEVGDKRKTWLEIVKHAVTAGIAYLFVKLG